MSEEVLIIVSLSFIIFLSPLISKMTKIPTTPIEIILGSLFVYLNLISHNYVLELVAELGFLYLMFLAGLEVDLRNLINIPKNILKKALWYNFLLYLFAIFVTLYFELGKIFIVALPLISIGILASLKKEYGEVNWIKIAIVVGLIGEIVSIILLTTVSAGLKFGFGWDFVTTMVLFTGFIVTLLIVYKFFHNLVWWFPEIKSYLMPEQDHQEQDIRLSMAIFFLMIAVMIVLELEVAFGAFIAGTFIKTYFDKHNKSLPTKLEHFGFGWLVPIFFIYTGASLGIDEIFNEGLLEKAFLIAIAMIVFRVFASVLFIKEMGNRFYMLGLSHSMPLTLLIAVATLAYHNQSITQFYYYAFILAAILQVLIVMITIRLINHFFIKVN